MFDSVKDGSERETETAVDCCIAVASLTVAKPSTRSAGCGGCNVAAALEWEAATDAHCCEAVASLTVAKLSTRSAGCGGCKDPAVLQ